MQPTMTSSDWLRRAADASTEADATAGPEVRHANVLIAEGCERLAKHAAFLAEGDAYPPVGWFSEMKQLCGQGSSVFRPQISASANGCGAALKLPGSAVRGLLALLITPFLLLAALGVALWAIAPHKKLADILETARRRSRWWVAVDIAAAVLGVATIDLLVDAF